MINLGFNKIYKRINNLRYEIKEKQQRYEIIN